MMPTRNFADLLKGIEQPMCNFLNSAETKISANLNEFLTPIDDGDDDEVKYF